MKQLIALFIVSLFSITSLNAQEDDVFFGFYGKISLESEKGSFVSVSLFDDNKLISTYTTKKNGKFVVDVPSNKHYTLEFEKEGYVVKRVIINTRKVPVDDLIMGGFAFDVHLIKKELEIDYSVLDFPITLIEYKKNKGGFNYNRKYTIQMKKIQKMIVANEEVVSLFY